jgi:hypothetical protein
MTETQCCRVGLVSAVEKERQWPRDPGRFTEIKSRIEFKTRVISRNSYCGGDWTVIPVFPSPVGDVTSIDILGVPALLIAGL